MAAIGVSEFSFGFAFLSEQVALQWGNLTAVPILPSLQQEQQQGWDATLPVAGAPQFYQFKVADVLKSRRSKFIRDGTYNAPYFRIALHKKNDNEQHRRLRELSITEPDTYYVAPEMDSYDEFNQSFLDQTVLGSSRLIPVRDCDDIRDSKQHFLTFQKGLADWIQHSKPKIRKSSLSGTGLFDRAAAHQDFRKVDQSFSRALVTRLEAAARKTLAEREWKAFDEIRSRSKAILADQTPRAELREASMIATAFFGCSLVLVGQRPE